MDCSMAGLCVPYYLLEFAQVHEHWSVMLSNHLSFCLPLLLFSVLPSIKVFPGESAFHIRWPKYGSLSISPSNEYSGLISFRIDWFYLLVIPGTVEPGVLPSMGLHRVGHDWSDLAAASAVSLSLLFSRSVVSDFLQPHGLQHTRLPCPSPSPVAY